MRYKRLYLKCKELCQKMTVMAGVPVGDVAHCGNGPSRFLSQNMHLV